MKIITQRGLHAQAVILRSCVNDLLGIITGRAAAPAAEAVVRPCLSPPAVGRPGGRAFPSASADLFRDIPAARHV